MKLSTEPNVSSIEDDHHLMERLRMGDKEALGTLYEKYKHNVMGYICHMIRDRGAAEELMHEVFLKVYEGRESYAPRAKFSTWLWSIARNITIDAMRRRGVKYRYTDMIIQEGDVKIETADPEVKLLEKSSFVAVENCLQKLPDRQRDAVNLRTFADNSYDEIADLMDSTASAVKLLVHRGKKALLICLEGRGVVE